MSHDVIDLVSDDEDDEDDVPLLEVYNRNRERERQEEATRLVEERERAKQSDALLHLAHKRKREASGGDESYDPEEDIPLIELYNKYKHRVWVEPSSEDFEDPERRDEKEIERGAPDKDLYAIGKAVRKARRKHAAGVTDADEVRLGSLPITDDLYPDIDWDLYVQFDLEHLHEYFRMIEQKHPDRICMMHTEAGINWFMYVEPRRKNRSSGEGWGFMDYEDFNFAVQTFYDRARRCLNKSARFVAIGVTISPNISTAGASIYAPPPLHENMMIIDKAKKTISRFEPNGHGVPFYDSSKMDALFRKSNILKVIKRGFRLPDLQFLSTNKTCPETGPQALEDENRSRVLFPDQYRIDTYGKRYKAELPGYCYVWSTMYLHYRILNPDKSPREVQDVMGLHDPNLLAQRMRQYIVTVVKAYYLYTRQRIRKDLIDVASGKKAAAEPAKAAAEPAKAPVGQVHGQVHVITRIMPAWGEFRNALNTEIFDKYCVRGSSHENLSKEYMARQLQDDVFNKEGSRSSRILVLLPGSMTLQNPTWEKRVMGFALLGPSRNIAHHLESSGLSVPEELRNNFVPINICSAPGTARQLMIRAKEIARSVFQTKLILETHPKNTEHYDQMHNFKNILTRIEDGTWVTIMISRD